MKRSIAGEGPHVLRCPICAENDQISYSQNTTSLNGWRHFDAEWLHFGTALAIMVIPEIWTASATPSRAGVGPNRSDASIRREAPEAI